MDEEAKERNIYEETGHYSANGTWRRTRLANAKDNIRAGLVIIEAWFRGY